MAGFEVLYAIKVLLSLLFILAIIYGIRFAYAKRFQIAGSRTVQVMERVPLEPGVTIYVLDVNHIRWLVSVTNKHVQFIEKLKESADFNS